MLTAFVKEIGSLEHKLAHARTLLDDEIGARKKAEADRDRLSSQLLLLRQLVMDDHLVDEVKLSRIRTIGAADFRSDDDNYSPYVTPKGILKKINMTEESIRDVEDFSFDDTRDLCNTRSRLERRSDARKRSRSHGRENIGENILENIASPRNDGYQLRKRSRRSRSAVNFEKFGGGTAAEETEMRPRANSAHERNIDASSPLSGGHSLVHKTIIKAEKCSACDKRIKFGKIALKCGSCRMVLHSECSDLAPVLCSRGAGSPVSRTPLGDRNRSPSKKSYFASPMLR